MIPCSWEVKPLAGVAQRSPQYWLPECQVPSSRSPWDRSPRVEWLGNPSLVPALHGYKPGTEEVAKKKIVKVEASPEKMCEKG